MGDIETYRTQTFEAIKQINEYGMEYWTGRELAKILEYGRWGNFVNVVNKAKEACKNSGYDPTNHIADVSNMIKIGKGGKRKVDDYELSRYACYLIVQNSDPRKEVVAMGQTYFAIQTRRQEQAEQIREDLIKLLLEKSNPSLRGIAAA